MPPEVLRIPKVWDWLLALESIPTPCDRARADTPVDALSPFRDDEREVGLDVAGLRLVARLCSGETNYWLEWEVWKDGERIWESPDPEHELTDEIVISLAGQPRVAARIARYESEKPRKRGGRR